MKYNLNQIVSGTFAVLGVLCVSSGVAMSNMTPTADVTNEVVKLSVSQKRVTKINNNEIVLKDITLEVNGSLSTNVKDYLKNPDNIDSSIIKKLKLDTSNVILTTAGNYTYTITCNKKVYNGKVIVKDKDDKKLDSLTLNELSFEVGQELPKDLSSYIKETLTDDIKAKIKIDLSNVDITKAGSYQYSINYNGKTYTNNITIYEPKYGNNSVVVENAKTTNIVVDNNNKTTDNNTTDNTNNNTTPNDTPQDDSNNNDNTDSNTGGDTQPNENP